VRERADDFDKEKRNVHADSVGRLARVCAGLRECARACASVRGLARVWTGLRECAQGLRECARACASVGRLARVCAGLRESARACASVREHKRERASDADDTDRRACAGERDDERGTLSFLLRLPFISLSLVHGAPLHFFLTGG
jgi:hypothetical protein